MGRKHKSVHSTLYCEECNLGHYTTRRNKKGPNKVELKKFCKKCRAHKPHKSKDTKH